MNQNLQDQINTLREELDLLKKSSSFPRSVETAIRERIGVPGFLVGEGTGAAGTSVITSFPATVGQVPSGTLTIEFNGQTYDLLYQ